MVSSSPSASSGLERDKFDNKTVSFEEHIKFEHNMWNYLYFIVLVRVKNKTDYTGPESYVAQMIKVWTPPGSSGHQGRGGGGGQSRTLVGGPAEEQLGAALTGAPPAARATYRGSSSSSAWPLLSGKSPQQTCQPQRTCVVSPGPWLPDTEEVGEQADPVPGLLLGGPF